MGKYKIGDKVKDSVDDGDDRKVKVKYKNIFYRKQWRREHYITRVIESEE